MRKLLARIRALRPTQAVACLVVLQLTFFGALALLWIFTRWNARQQ